MNKYYHEDSDYKKKYEIKFTRIKIKILPTKTALIEYFLP